MKPTSHNQESELLSRTEPSGTGTGSVNRVWKRSLRSISFKRRYANRRLRTGQLLNLMRREAPHFFEMAEVVGQWVWIHFEHRQPPTVTRTLSELGFHWNKRRQTWQHPCGSVTAGTPRNPRDIYGSYFPADTNPA